MQGTETSGGCDRKQTHIPRSGFLNITLSGKFDRVSADNLKRALSATDMPRLGPLGATLIPIRRNGAILATQMPRGFLRRCFLSGSRKGCRAFFRRGAVHRTAARWAPRLGGAADQGDGFRVPRFGRRSQTSMMQPPTN